jgi:AAA-like domain
MDSLPFYVVGGTLGLDVPSYIEPGADAEILGRVQAGEFCYVLTARQMGKSSLMIRTAEKLRDGGYLAAVVDLSDCGSSAGSVTPEQWYYSVTDSLARVLAPDEILNVWWAGQSNLPPVRRLVRFLREVILVQTTAPVVVFLDEIDSMLGLTFRDDFFAAIRACYNARANDPVYKHLVFVPGGYGQPLRPDHRSHTHPVQRRHGHSAHGLHH